MTILKDVVAELFGMFVSDGTLAAAIVSLVAVSAGLVRWATATPLIGGGILLVGSLLLVIESVRRTARATSAE